MFSWLGCRDIWAGVVTVDDYQVHCELLIIDHFYDGDQVCKLYSENLQFAVDVVLPDTVGCYYDITLARSNPCH